MTTDTRTTQRRRAGAVTAHRQRRNHGGRLRRPRRFLMAFPSAAAAAGAAPPEGASDEAADIPQPLTAPADSVLAAPSADLESLAWEGSGLLARVRPAGAGAWLVQAVGPSGRAEAVSVPPALPDLAAFTAGSTDHERWQAARRTGIALFRAAFPPAVERLLEEARHRAGEAAVPVALDVSDPALAPLPWELLRDPETDRFLAMGERTPLSRLVPAAGTATPRPPESGHLRVRVLAETVDEPTMAEAEAVGADPNVDVSVTLPGAPAKIAPHVLEAPAALLERGEGNIAAPLLVVEGAPPATSGDRAAVVAVPDDMPPPQRETFLAALYTALAASEPVDRATTLARRAVADAHSVVALGWARPVLVVHRPPAPLVAPARGSRQVVGQVSGKVKEHGLGFVWDCLSGTVSSAILFYIGLVLYRFGVSSSQTFDFEAVSPFSIYQSFKGLVVELSTYQEYILLAAAGVLALLTALVTYLWLRDRTIDPEEQPGLAAKLAGPLSSLRLVSFLAVATLTVLGAFAYQQYLWNVLLPIPKGALGIAITREAAAASFSDQLADAMFTQGQTQDIVVRELPVRFDASDTAKARALGKRIGARAVLIYRADGHDQNGKPQYVAYVVFTDPGTGLSLGAQPGQTTADLQAPSQQQQVVQLRQGVDVPVLKTDTLTGLVDAAAGILSYEDGRYRDAITHLQLALPKDPAAPNGGIVNFYLGRAYDLDGQAGPAATAYERAAAFYEGEQRAGTKLGPRDELVLAKAYYQRGRIAAFDNQWDRAEAWYKKAVALRGDLLARANDLDSPAEVHLTYGVIYGALADAARATGNAEDQKFWQDQTTDEVAAILSASNPKDPGPYVDQSAVLFFAGSCVDATAALDKALALQPENADALNNVAVVAYVQGQLALAQAHVTQLTTVRPDDIGARSQLADLLVSEGLGYPAGDFFEPAYMAQAAETYREILTLDPANLNAHDQLAALAYYRGIGQTSDLTALMAGDGETYAKSKALWTQDPKRRQAAVAAFGDEIAERRVIATTLQPGSTAAEVALAAAYGHRQQQLYDNLTGGGLTPRDAEAQATGRQLVSDTAQILDWTGKVLAPNSGATRLERLQAWDLRVWAMSREWTWYAVTQDKEALAALVPTYVQESKQALAFAQQVSAPTPAEETELAQIYLNDAFVAKAFENDEAAYEQAYAKFDAYSTQSQGAAAQSNAHLATYCTEDQERAAGDAALAQGDLAAARKHYAAAVATNPHDAQSLNDLGWVLYQQGDVKGAIAQALAAANAAPDDAASWANLGLYDIAAGDATGANAAYARFLAVVGKRPPQARMANLGAAVKNLRNLLDKQRQRAPQIMAEIPAFQRLLDGMAADGKGTFEYPALYSALGNLALFADDPAAAERLLRQGIALDPHQSVARADLALAVLAQGHDPAPEIAAAIAEARDPLWQGIGNGETGQLTAMATEVLRFAQRFPQRGESVSPLTSAIAAEHTRMRQGEATPTPAPSATPSATPSAAR